MRTQTVNVPGKAYGMARPRFQRGYVRSPDVGGYKERVGQYALASGMRPVEGPVVLVMHIDVMMPASWPKKKKNRMRGQMVDHTPDGVNISCAIHDGLEGIAYANDKQVSDSTITRRWQDEENTRITISWGFNEEAS
jgi:Holliday junction resolvase RusA-like endonuclease